MFKTHEMERVATRLFLVQSYLFIKHSRVHVFWLLGTDHRPFLLVFRTITTHPEYFPLPCRIAFSLFVGSDTVRIN